MNEAAKTSDICDCVVGWSPSQSRLVGEVIPAPRMLYDCTIHNNMTEYIAWLIKTTAITEEGFYGAYGHLNVPFKEFAGIKNCDPVDAWLSANIVTNQGKNALNDIMFHGSTQITQWYVVLINTNTTPAATMTYATPVYTESADYDESTRQAFNEGASSSQVISNTSSRAVFTMNATSTIYGCALVGGGSAASTKSDTAGGGTLYSMSKFSEAKSVVATNVLSVGISITQS